MHVAGMTPTGISKEVPRHRTSIYNALIRLGHRECMETRGKKCVKR